MMRLGSLAAFGICLCLSGAHAAHPTNDVFTIFVSPTGDDRNSGLSQSNAVLSLDRAQNILRRARPDSDVEIQIAPGTYYDQRVRWTFTMPDHNIKFMPLGGTKVRPVFDGCRGPASEPSGCRGGTWFTLNAASGQPSNLQFHYIRVERYGTAISFAGNRDAASRSNGRNTVFGSYFKDIGNGFNTRLKPSTAAIRFVNSDDNRVSNNHFVNIENVGRRARSIHALYVAHLSTGNEISRNRFVNVSGDAIRFRDGSNYNRIVRNKISRSGVVGFSDWYCDSDSRSDCTKRQAECPSWENTFRENVLDGTYQCRPMKVSEFYQDDSVRRCAPPPRGAKRLHLEGNRNTAKPCSLD